MNKLYKYQGTVSEMTARGQTATEIVLYDSNDDSKAPTRLSVSGALAKYIYEIEMTDAEERYLTLNWYFDRCLYLRSIEVPSSNPYIPAKVITQSEPWSEELAVFGHQEYIESREPEPMSREESARWGNWRNEQFANR